jgi:uncharacterized membrane protein
MHEMLSVAVRWIHIASVTTLIGGMIYGRLVMAPAGNSLAPELREQYFDRAASAFRPLAIAAILGLILSGTYNFLSNPGHQPLYHAMFGIKILLALHVFAVSILITKPKNPRRVRLMTGAMISGLVIIFISAWLRHNF